MLWSATIDTMQPFKSFADNRVELVLAEGAFGDRILVHFDNF